MRMLRLAAFVLDTRHRLVGNNDDAAFALRLPLDQRDLADLLALRFVYVNRVLRGMRGHGILGFHRNVVTVYDSEALEAAALGGGLTQGEQIGLTAGSR